MFTEVRRDVVREVEGRLHLVRLHERRRTRASEDGESFHARLARRYDRVACAALKTHEDRAQATQRIPLGLGGNLRERLHAFLQVVLCRSLAFCGAVGTRGDHARGVLNHAFGPLFPMVHVLAKRVALRGEDQGRSEQWREKGHDEAHAGIDNECAANGKG